MAYDRKWLHFEVDEDTWRNVHALATVRGQNAGVVCEDLLKEGLLKAAEEEYATGDAAVDLHVYAGVARVRRQARLRAQLSMIAFEHNQAPTEETADLLLRLCNLVGVSVEEIAKDSEDAKIKLVQDNGYGVNSASRWLVDYLKDCCEAPVVQVMEAGHRMGFTPAVIRAAKTNIGLQSIRRSTWWVWAKPVVVGVDTNVETEV